MKGTKLLIFSAMLPLSLTAATIKPQGEDEIKDQYSSMVQGGVGLIQTPTSRMRAQGSMLTTYTDNDEYRFWSVSLQLFDWMEATARYTDVRTRLYSDVPSFSGNQTLKDKGLDVKFRLWEESYYLPQIAVGFRDFGGTGFFESEYVTASKAWGDFDFHLGVGWGYLGGHDDITNPFCEIKESFCQRPTGFSGRGGKIDYNQFFKGPMAVFGGVEYQSPWQPLRIKLEYEGNNYVNDRAGALVQDSRWNLGAVYRWENLDLSLNYQRGNTVGFGLSYVFDLNNIKQYKSQAEKVEPSRFTKPLTISEVDKAALYRDIVLQTGFAMQDAELTDKQFTIYGSQLAYRDRDEATERIGRIMAAHLPESVETFHIVDNHGAIPMLETVIDADKFYKTLNYEDVELDIRDTYHRQTPSNDVMATYEPALESGFGFATDLFWTQTFGSPEEFYMYQIGVILSGGYSFNANSMIAGSIRVNLLDNFDKFTFTVDRQDSALPRVRTFVREYVTRTNVGTDTLYAQWTDRIGENLFAQAYGGYLETMFAGVGGEVLYRPVDSTLAFGADINYVQQRSFESEFGLFDYKAITGHASVYWRPEFLPDTQLIVSAGQFLAKDKGVNIDFAKRFDSGVIVGAFAAFTNVSAEEYGEGSFTKGFYVSVPLDLFVLTPARGRGEFPWIPISRDGGQMLRRPTRLIMNTEIRSPFFD